MKERLQKVMSNCGVASRRASEQLILAGKVRVNGVVVRELGTKVDLDKDMILVDGKRLEAEKKRYFLFNKPKGVITTASDDQGRETVMDYFKKVPERIYPVGRLDQNTEGLLLMTNDGELANILMHPSKLVDKTYEVKIKSRIADTVLQQLADGVELDMIKTMRISFAIMDMMSIQGLPMWKSRFMKAGTARSAACLNILACRCTTCAVSSMPS